MWWGAVCDGELGMMVSHSEQGVMESLVFWRATESWM